MTPLVLNVLHKFYAWVVSPVIHAWAGPSMGCRHEPTCSVYAGNQIREHGWLRGGWRAFWRVCRCHPFASHVKD